MFYYVKPKALTILVTVEGDDIFHGDVDVIVCDGFVGNVTLKTIEGLARMLTQELKAEFKKSIFSKNGCSTFSARFKSIW